MSLETEVGNLVTQTTALVATVTNAVQVAAINLDVQAVEARKNLAIDTEIPAAIETLKAFTSKGAWTTNTAYAIKDLVSNGGDWYVCVMAHVSSPAFATDTGIKWRIYQGITSGSLGASSGSSLVGYMPDGVGVFATTAQAKLRESVSVLDFCADGVSGAKVDPTGVISSSAGIQAAITACSISHKTLFVPAGKYRLTTPIIVPAYSSIIGEGTERTLFLGNEVPGVVFTLENSGTPTFAPTIAGPSPVNYYADFSVIGLINGTLASIATGGIHCKQYNTTFDRVSVLGFTSGGYTTIGNPGTELKFGFHIDYVVNTTLNGCASSANDIGYLEDNTNAATPVSPTTSTVYNECWARINRTHALKVVNFLHVKWNGGGFESNNGLVTILFKPTAATYCTGSFVGDVYFENNNRLSASRAAGTKLIHFDNSAGLAISSGLIISHTNIGGNGTSEYTLDVMNADYCTIQGGVVNGPVRIDASTNEFNSFGVKYLSGLTNSSVGGVVIGNITVIKRSADLAGASPYVTGINRAILPAVSVSNLLGGVPGQIIEVESQAGSAFVDSSVNFKWPTGATNFKASIGCLLTLRRNEAGTAWVFIGSVTTAIPENAPNSTGPTIDERDLWYVGDANTSAFSNIIAHGNGRTITLASNHTGANTTIVNNTGNIKLIGGANFAMGVGDVLILKKVNSIWYEISRHNAA